MSKTGFNQLTTTEQTIIKMLIDDGKAPKFIGAYMSRDRGEQKLFKRCANEYQKMKK